MLRSSMDLEQTESGKRKSLAGVRRDAMDRERMVTLAAYTARSLATEKPVPFGACVIRSKGGEMLSRTLNAVAAEFDPSSHAEVRAIRRATKKLKKISLSGYTLYTTCEPCPMCMSAALWAGLDRVVYGATIEDASRHCRQIYVPASEVAERSDMQCEVTGPVEREVCDAIFNDPRMVKAFKAWSSGRSGARGRKQAG